MWFLISWLHQKPADLDLQCFPKRMCTRIIMKLTLVMLKILMYYTPVAQILSTSAHPRYVNVVVESVDKNHSDINLCNADYLRALIYYTPPQFIIYILLTCSIPVVSVFNQGGNNVDPDQMASSEAS